MLGIDIKVNSKQVVDAKKQIEILNQAMNDTDTLGDLTIGAGASREVKKMADEIRKLKQISNQGDSKGGILSKQQFMDAQRLLGQINSGVQNYAREVAKVRAEYKALNQEQAKLATLKYNGTATAEDLKQFQRNKERMRELSQERSDLESQRQRMMHIGAGASDSADRISGMNEAGGMGGLKKAIKWGMAAVAGFGIFQLLGQARAKYQQSVGHEATLAGRGIRGGFGGTTGLGLGPVEYMAMTESMSGSVGSAGAKSSAKSAAAFARAHGMDPSDIGGFYNTMYTATGDSNQAGGVLKLIDAFKKGMDKAKISEVMSLVARNTNITAQAMGGTGATQTQTAMNTALAIMGVTSGNQFAKSGEYSNFMQNGFKGASTTAGNIRLHSAMGGFKSGFNWNDQYDIMKIQQEGPLARPDVLHKLMGGYKGDTKTRAAMFATDHQDIKLSAAEALFGMFDRGDFEKLGLTAKDFAGVKSGSKQEKEMIGKWTQHWKSNGGQAADKLDRMAQAEALFVQAGGKLDHAMANFDKAMLELSKTVLNSDLAGRMLNAMEKMGKFFENPAKETAKSAISEVVNVPLGLVGLKLNPNRKNLNTPKTPGYFAKGDANGFIMSPDGGYITAPYREDAATTKIKSEIAKTKSATSGSIDRKAVERLPSATQQTVLESLGDKKAVKARKADNPADYLKGIHDMLASYLYGARAGATQ